MGSTNARQFQCDLCRQLLLSDDGQLPDSWQRSEDSRLTVCSACEAAVLRVHVDTLVNSVGAACRALMIDVKSPESHKINDHVNMLDVARGMIQREMIQRAREARKTADLENDAIRRGV